ncbi:MAG: hypothetical protein A2Y00_02395 [Omnitrophica WOR_2 bacterium GWF2_43_52]|nr:MAG: hypothetical protein A2062_01735 [Omnitrophica WOR_2 bacterium GWA2_44_7]OGX14598.1 MAG: hypothetical protein A2Y01_06290 [Omnitrophica WOR_2 bacterium GWC2_44_8]OGX20291.1 MAG: hypothetical protein A2Y00_02395 [Omnitrophica WOR_2 bacterium GWF2_43_52]HAH21280.1 hypothetical protein [Candidatus Omnitrophota bacterium]HBG63908.1 hypothetical protein [Candidatus Omnitrophota bacterium]
MEKKTITALVIDDEKAVVDFLVQFLGLKAVQAKTVEDCLSALEAARKESFDIVFLDVRMPRMNGVELLRELKKINPHSMYVMMTGYAVDDLLEQARREGARIHLKKPFDIEEISHIIEECRHEKTVKDES